MVLAESAGGNCVGGSWLPRGSTCPAWRWLVSCSVQSVCIVGIHASGGRFRLVSDAHLEVHLGDSGRPQITRPAQGVAAPEQRSIGTKIDLVIARRDGCVTCITAPANCMADYWSPGKFLKCLLTR